MDKMTKEQRRNGRLLLEEAQRDIEAEGREMSVSIGEMQRVFPAEYQNARKYVQHWWKSLVDAATSLEQARKLSGIIHAENDWVSLIPDVVDDGSPLNVDILEHLVALECNPRASEWLSSLHDVLSMQPVSILTVLHLIRLERKQRAKKSAHAKNGIHREIEKQVLEMWASGKYKTHDKCALKACEKYPGRLSYSTAMRYLRGAPRPLVTASSD